MSAPALLSCVDLTVCYGKRPAVHHLSAELPRGAFAAVVGPNGAGKSTLLQGILGWLPVTTGTALIDGSPAARARSRVSYLPQRRGGSLLEFPITVAGVVQQGRFARRGLFAGFGPADREAVDGALAAMGLTGLRDQPLARLSGGQQQRAFIARALASGADVLLLDEPLAGLDAGACHDLLARLRAWAEGGRLVVAVLHEIAAARRWCTHALLLNGRAVSFGDPASALTEAHLAEAYGTLPLEATP
jgi:ABC-type Mn2+/Zn2+ transport system ATPase subunit